MAEEKIFGFIKTQNRPLSVTEIQQNVGNDVSRNELNKTLNSLVESKSIFEKTYGKQKIYCVLQHEQDAGLAMDEELKKLDRCINTLTTNIEDISKKLRTESSKYPKNEKNMMTLDQAAAEKLDLENQISSLKSELQRYEENSKPMSEKEKLKICEQYQKYDKEYKSRKKICQEIINQIMENYPKSEKILLEEMGIETDADVGFKYEPVLK